jgi:hypothetical protein
LSTAIKYTIGTVLIILSLAMLFRNHSFQQKESMILNGDPAGSINLPVNLDTFEEHIANLNLPVNTDETNILPFLALNVKVCPPCVNNVVEYAELLKESDQFFEPILVFADKEDSVVKRFMATNGLDMPYEILRSEDGNSPFHESVQNLLFVDIHEQTAFYSIDIPNVTTPLTYKKDELHEVAMNWKHLVEREPGHASF